MVTGENSDLVQTLIRPAQFFLSLWICAVR